MKIASLILALFGSLLVFSAGAVPAKAYDILAPACKDVPSSNAVCSDAAKQKPGNNPVIRTIATATHIISMIIGFVAVILIVVSGLNMITSGGNAESIANARKRLTAAVVGLVIASLAWVLSSFLVSKIL